MNVALNAFTSPVWVRSDRKAVVESPPPPGSVTAPEDGVQQHPRTEVSILPASEGALLSRYDNTGTYVVSYTNSYAKFEVRSSRPIIHLATCSPFVVSIHEGHEKDEFDLKLFDVKTRDCSKLTFKQDLVGGKVVALFANEQASVIVGGDNHIYSVRHEGLPKGSLVKIELKDHSIIRRIQSKTSVLKDWRLLLASPTELQLWNLSKGELLFRYRTLNPLAVKFSTFEFDKIIAIGESINIWTASLDVDQSQVINIKPEKPVTTFAIAGNHLIVGTVGREIYSYSLEDGSQVGKIVSPTPAPGLVASASATNVSTKIDKTDASPQKIKSFARSLKKTLSSFQMDHEKDKDKAKEEKPEEDKGERGRHAEKDDDDTKKKRHKSKGRTPRDGEGKREKTPREISKTPREEPDTAKEEESKTPVRSTTPPLIMKRIPLETINSPGGDAEKLHESPKHESPKEKNSDKVVPLGATSAASAKSTPNISVKSLISPRSTTPGVTSSPNLNALTSPRSDILSVRRVGSFADSARAGVKITAMAFYEGFLAFGDDRGQLTLTAVVGGRFADTLGSMNISDAIESISFDSPSIYVIGWEPSRQDGSFFTWTHQLQELRRARNIPDEQLPNSRESEKANEESADLSGSRRARFQRTKSDTEKKYATLGRKTPLPTIDSPGPAEDTAVRSNRAQTIGGDNAAPTSLILSPRNDRKEGGSTMKRSHSMKRVMQSILRADMWENNDSDDEVDPEPLGDEIGVVSNGDKILNRLEWNQLDVASEVLPWSKVESFQSEVTTSTIVPDPNWNREIVSLDRNLTNVQPNLTVFCAQRVYSEQYFRREKTMWVSEGKIDAETDLGPLVLLERDDGDAILFSKKGYLKISMKKSDMALLHFVCVDVFGLQISQINFTEVKDQMATKSLKLLDLETQFIPLKHKMGVLAILKDHKDEKDIFANTTISEDFQEFLSFLGDPIDLFGWKDYNGGLDVSKEKRTGEKAIFVPDQERRGPIMFHVGPMIPEPPSDPTRKRHIGNDVLVVLFNETGAPVDVAKFKSQFNHVFVVVEKVPDMTTTHYRVEVAAKGGVLPLPPFIPFPPIFEKSFKFKRWFITKLINLETSALCYAKAFVKQRQIARGGALKVFVDDCLSRHDPDSRENSFSSSANSTK